MNSYLESALKQFEYYRALGAKTLDQLEDSELIKEPVDGVNSIAIIVKHLHGNMRSRWLNFLTEDGEKPDRNREGEFEGTLRTKAEIRQVYDAGWEYVFEALRPLGDADLERIVYIRNQGHTVSEAINRQLCHYAYHIGQIVFIGKMMRGDDWKSLSIPKGGSVAYNDAKFSKEKERKHFTDDELKK